MGHHRPAKWVMELSGSSECDGAIYPRLFGVAPRGRGGGSLPSPPLRSSFNAHVTSLFGSQILRPHTRPGP